MKEREQNDSFKNEEMEQLIVATLLGTISRKEEIALQQWRSESELNKKLYQDFVEAWRASQLLNEMQGYNTTKALNTVKKKIHVKTKGQYYLSIIQKIAAVLFLPLFIASSLFIVYLSNQMTDVETAWQTVQCPAGLRSEMFLPDGTKVWLNAGSELQFPAVFKKEERKVKVTGEVFFDVEADSSRPFLVDIEDLTVKVLGTRFNVLNDSESELLEVSLEEGKVVLYKGDPVHQDNFLTAMNPGEKVSYNRTSNSIVKSIIDTSGIATWKEGKLVFFDASIQEVAKKLEHWYNVDIQLHEKSNWDDFLLTATFEDESLTQILDILNCANEIGYKIEKNRNIKGQKQIKLSKK